MSKLLLSFFTLSISYVSFSQKSLEVYYDYNWRETFADNARFYAFSKKTDTGWYKQVFYVSIKKLQMVGLYEDKENTIQNGTFYWAYPNNSFESIGKFVHGKKEGVWLDYYSNGSLKDSMNYHDGHLLGISLSWYKNGFSKDSTNMNESGEGVYVSWFNDGSPSCAGRYIAFDKRNGTWQYFHKNGKLSAIEVYDKDSLLSKKYFDEKGDLTKDTSLHDKDPQFPGGDKAWSKYLSAKLFFPSGLEFSNSDHAVVVVSGIIDEEGKIIDAEIAVPFHPKFDEIALNAIKRSPLWQPAIDHNRKVYHQFLQAVSFGQSFR